MFARNEAAPAEMPGVNGIVEAWVRGAEGPQLAAALEARGFTDADPGRGAAHRVSRQRHRAPARRARPRATRYADAQAAGGHCRTGSHGRRRRSTCCAGSCACSRPSARARRTSRCSTRMRRCGASSWSLRRTANSWRRRSPRIRCCSTSCWTKAPDRAADAARGTRGGSERAARAPRRGRTRAAGGRLRQFQRAAIFRVAMADLTGTIPLMRVSDYLTEIAEIIVEQAMRLAWAQMTAQFGVPQTNRGDGPGRRAVNICAVGLREVRRQRARLRLGPRSRVPARRPR